jgi:hypothetical protein
MTRLQFILHEGASLCGWRPHTFVYTGLSVADFDPSEGLGGRRDLMGSDVPQGNPLEHLRLRRVTVNSLGQRLQRHLVSDRQDELADHLTAMRFDECGSDDLSWLLPTYAREETRESHAMPHLFLKSDRPGGVLGIPCEPQYHQEKESLMGSIILRPGMCDQRRLFNTKFFRVGQEMSRSRGQTPPDAYTPSV